MKLFSFSCCKGNKMTGRNFLFISVIFLFTCEYHIIIYSPFSYIFCSFSNSCFPAALLKEIRRSSRISVLSKIRFVKSHVEYNFQRKELRIFTLKKLFPACKTVQSTCQHVNLSYQRHWVPEQKRWLENTNSTQPKRGWSY